MKTFLLFLVSIVTFVTMYVPTTAQDFKFTDENDKFYDEPVDSVTGRWERIYRGNDTTFYVTKTACASTIHLVQMGAYNYLNTLQAPRRWSIRLSDDGGYNWNEIYSDSTPLQPLESIEFTNLYYPSPTTIIVVGFIQKFEKFDSNFNPVFSGKSFLLRSIDFGESWIFDTTFFTKNFPSDVSTTISLTSPNQGLIMTKPAGAIASEKNKLFRWNYFLLGNQLIDTLYEMPFPTILQNKEIEHIISGGVGPRRVYLFTERNATDDAPTTPSGAYTSDQGLTWLPMQKRSFFVDDNKLTLIDEINTDGVLVLGGAEIFFQDDRGDFRADEVITLSTNGGVTQKEIWRKKRAPFNGVFKCVFADANRGMFIVNRERNFGVGSVLSPDGIPDTVGFYGFEPMIYRTDDGGTSFVREPLNRLYHFQSPVADMASGIRDVFYRRDASGNRLRIFTTHRDVFRFVPIPPTSVSDNNNSGTNSMVTISPNPVSQSAFVKYELPVGEQSATITIHDALGMEVISIPMENSKEGHIHIGTSKLANGTYHLRIRKGSFTTSQLLVVHR